ncbi:hypothetical protein BASA50_006895 [Batrachochytrium salamandrivorans]|uniref:Mediator of RNA polymerase II transcription subunit 11 n=1 Tax=Batrachochytrium salamandrivorans TaxID=1357716 RepID=A0ABQ8F8U0_9FUNG|nr:hypothetical protein BASA62_001997 [Batrachochytrium salamandrivorans]KAH6575340.1 hypothetical protein BASA60_005089 [Batrachochytrium salamandrivorans]KAH6583605.1 hypothetical protein BASA61_007936 [Batrachochytrium salamandrivorans]KAH6593985.1 hypothetical protein BASA50_006895 [Batrachochytrium salamandrivorans]KAH9251423.1 hypothetical protein BASA81_010717 [Batrachochytrium salamandrivorans]
MESDKKQPSVCKTPAQAVQLDDSQSVAQIHGVEKRLLNALSLASQAILLLDQPNKDPEDIKEAFEEKCVILGNVITEIQSGLRTLLFKFASTGVLDAAGQQLEYNITTSGVEKDLEIITNGISLLRSELAHHQPSPSSS